MQRNWSKQEKRLDGWELFVFKKDLLLYRGEQRFFSRSQMSIETALETLQWTAHPARENRKKTFATVLFILAFCGIVLIGFSSVEWAVFSFVILFGSLARFFLPSSYILTPQEVKSTFLGISRKYPWSSFRAVHTTRGGLFLSPYATPNRLESFRGMLLLCGKNKSEVLDFAKRHINRET